MTLQRIYWDSSCFISYINRDSEPIRHEICADVLHHAQNDQIEIWTSCWTIAETIRPREQFVIEPLPNWATILDQTNKDGQPNYPGAREQLQRIWDYYHRSTRETRVLPADQAQKIKGMFAWRWIHKILVTPALATKAAEISRDTGLKPADAIHVASALARGCSMIQRWDRNFKKTDGLIPSDEPRHLSPRDLFNANIPAPN